MDRFEDQELIELLVKILMKINPDRDPEEAKRKATAAVARRNEVAEQTPSITCPRCGWTSYNRNDIEWGYCGNCHDYTSGGRHETD